MTSATGERKLAGVLAQVENGRVIAGIGINIAQPSFPDNLDTPATSLAMEGIVTTREALLPLLLDAVDRAILLPADELIRRFTAASTYVNGRRVRTGEIEGVTCGLDSSGFLRVREDSGAVHTILNGGVRPV